MDIFSELRRERSLLPRHHRLGLFITFILIIYKSFYNIKIIVFNYYIALLLKDIFFYNNILNSLIRKNNYSLITIKLVILYKEYIYFYINLI